MNLQAGGFDWDDGNRSKCRKHGVSIAEIETVFVRGPRVAPDPVHSTDEDRLIAVGKTSAGRPLFVAFTMRTKDGRRLIRPVTARYMHAREAAAYEKAADE
ncbi:MAG: BrnT family toxin [Terriglobales bacterium]